MVNKSGDTMTGSLNQRTPTGIVPGFILTSPDLDFSQSATENKSSGVIIFRDKNNKDGSYINNFVDSSGAVTLAIQASNGVGDNRKTTGLGVWIRQNGESGSWCNSSNGNNSILTTLSHGNNYVKLGNGLILQWGDKGNVSNVTITLPVPYSNNNYSVLLTNGAGGNNDYTGVPESKTSTGFHIGGNVTQFWFTIGW